jgi:D-aminopeptidase
VTVVRPVPGYIRDSPVFAGAHTLNGNGELTGLEWIRESGLLTTPIALTNTHSVGVVRDALARIDSRERRANGAGGALYFSLPVVGETYDGLLNDIDGQHVRAEDVHEAYEGAETGPVIEGSVGGGTGMVCHEFKGGIGTSSRLLPTDRGGWTVGALVQANHGRRRDLRVDGVQIGRHLPVELVPSPRQQLGAETLPAGAGSIIVILATDAPLLGDQCRRLAQRATIGLGRSGGGASDSSGDIFLAFSTAAQQHPGEYHTPGVPHRPALSAEFLHHESLTPLFAAAADATEEAILNALLAAGTMTGRDGIVAYGLTPELLAKAYDAETEALARTGEALRRRSLLR